MNRVPGMIDWRGAALARDGWISRIGYGACLAQKCVQQAAPASVASVWHPHRFLENHRIEALGENVALGNSLTTFSEQPNRG